MGAFGSLGIWLALQAHPGVPGGGPLTTTGAPAVLGARPAAVHVWVVRPGDTLWGIVESSGVKGDPRPAVDRLAAQAGGRALQPGERLVLP
ncbi:MAG TPA: LysM domain-containing protein [Acidimicrobiales bacterium]|nr:LysM domain-containing protein [Acidimicrobiales bacterium]